MRWLVAASLLASATSWLLCVLAVGNQVDPGVAVGFWFPAFVFALVIYWRAHGRARWIALVAAVATPASFAWAIYRAWP